MVEYKPQKEKIYTGAELTEEEIRKSTNQKAKKKMVRVKSIETSARNFAKKSLVAFLEGKKNLNWITAVIASSGVRGDKLREIFNELRDYGDKERFLSALERCEKENLFKEI